MINNRALWDRDWRKWQLVNSDYFITNKDNTRSRRIRWVMERLKKHNVKTVLDAGCGLGWHTEFLGRNGFKVEGRDISPVGIEIAKRMIEGITFKVEDILDMTDKDKYDAVLGLSVLICLDDPVTAMRKLYEAAKKYVYLTFDFFNTDETHVQNFTMEQSNKLLKDYNVSDTMLDDKYYYVEITK